MSHYTRPLAALRKAKLDMVWDGRVRKPPGSGRKAAVLNAARTIVNLSAGYHQGMNEGSLWGSCAHSINRHRLGLLFRAADYGQGVSAARLCGTPLESG